MRFVVAEYGRQRVTPPCTLAAASVRLKIAMLQELPVFVFMTFHYPSPETVAALAEGMARMRGWMESQPGCIGVDPPLLSQDGDCLVGYSRWESRQAFLATGIDIDTLGDTPSSELRPRQPYFLTSLRDE